ncbi:phosphoenolpyruvate carboxylase [Nonlabens spongiae]|uniref:Phosphoenolpyruvate carboxylase n=1 Tax=Nonlabens spongiae TaxID=331648 RepID=A0A1W6MHW7_9FLAO|nr:phosphoenolpyruvate carboxylase [Nonlabens spongiae]ARN77096.1 phosphoenolpyruvate carboxylase [Nonlabens spongiae]
MQNRTPIDIFEQEVASKYQIFNGIFMTLPFDDISNTGSLLPLFHKICRDGFERGKNPQEIVQYFFQRYMPDAELEERHAMLFRFIQYIERQVVLFDAIEDAAFSKVNNLEGRGTLKNVKEEAEALQKSVDLKQYLNNFKVRPVLTAHPTQFYPDEVLGIINDLSQAVAANDITQIKLLLSQLGKTPFFKKEKPTPYDEAVSLIWYLENVFYHAMGNIYDYVKSNIDPSDDFSNPLVEIGFWPGGDRDGNPFVTNEITLKVALRLRSTVLRNYYRDLRKITRRITFRGVHDRLLALQRKVYQAISVKEKLDFTAGDLIVELQSVKKEVILRHNALFTDLIDKLIHRIQLFGLHFAVLDIRQDSSIHDEAFEKIVNELVKLNQFTDLNLSNYYKLTEKKKINILTQLQNVTQISEIENDSVQRVLGSMQTQQQVQKLNGTRGCNRYIISNSQKISHILEVYAMLRLLMADQPQVHVVPLFETVPDLQNAPEIMDALFANPDYRAHIRHMGDKQDIMLGFSDGTKDGGYLMANWSIYKAKETLTEICRKHGVSVTFFDGRGGPPARGGGQTHQFYASMGSKIESNEIQLTVQGQTISSKFGTLDSCQFNLEQLISSGVTNGVYDAKSNDFSDEAYKTMESLAQTSYKAYQQFKQHPKFLPYLENMSTLKFYAKTNIGSRPSKRGNKKTLEFKDLRAIPFVGSWSQLKQNVPGFYGVGTALEKADKNGEWSSIENLYTNNKFFRTLLFNSMMSITKSFFDLTKYMSHDEEYGEFWNMIFEEYKRSKNYLLRLTGMENLMQNEPVGKASIQQREQIALPLLTIQQYALLNLQKVTGSNDEPLKQTLEKMVTRSLYGNINASRNSA